MTPFLLLFLFYITTIYSKCAQPLSTKTCVSKGNTRECDIICSEECECYNTKMECINGYICNFNCTGLNSCEKATIVGNLVSNINVFCDKSASTCFSMNISAPNSNELSVYCGDGDYCDNSIIECPKKGNHACKLDILGNDNDYIGIYSLQGFEGITFSNDTGKESFEEMTIICENNECTMPVYSTKKCLIPWICDPNKKENVFDCDIYGNNFTGKTIPCKIDETDNIKSCVYYCDERNCCHNSNIKCNDNNNCIIQCNEQNACLDTIFHCPENSRCDIYCDNEYSCTNSVIHCSKNSTCTIRCTSTDSCRYSNIICEEGSECTVECFSGLKSCEDIILDGKEAKSVKLSCYSGDHCDNINLYCPLSHVLNNGTINKNGTNCELISLGDDNNDIVVYSEHGFDNFKVIKNEDNKQLTQMNCGKNYTNSCFFNDKYCDPIWMCNNDVPSPTQKPSKNPTKFKELWTEDYFACDNPDNHFENHQLQCTSNTKCKFDCSADNCCESTHITCNKDIACDINCMKPYSCNTARIECNQIDECHINCDSSSSCYSSEIICPPNGNCFYRCTNDHSCEKSNIICEENSNCDIYCDANDVGVCENMIIDASKANSLNVKCNNLNDCNYITIKCPNIMKDGKKNCFLESLSEKIGMTIHSLNGFDSFEYKNTSSMESIKNTKMICGKNECEINENTMICNPKWLCNSLYIAPSVKPTSKPTDIESKVIKDYFFQCFYQDEFVGHDLDCVTNNLYKQCLFNCTESHCCRANSLKCQDNKLCRLHCSSTSACEHTPIECGKDGSCNIMCDGEWGCYKSHIHCQSGAHCKVQCRGEASCLNTKLTCSENSVCEVTCSKGDKSCQSLHIDGDKASYVKVNCVEGNYCDELKLHCPNNNNNNDVNCFLTAQGSDNENIRIYSKEGFKNFRLTSTKTDSLKLYCGKNYTIACEINHENNLCKLDQLNKCNPYNTTSQKAPTLQPTCFQDYFEYEIMYEMHFDKKRGENECHEIHYNFFEKSFDLKLKNIVLAKFFSYYQVFVNINEKNYFNFEKWWETKVDIDNTIDIEFHHINTHLIMYTDNKNQIEHFLNKVLSDNSKIIEYIKKDTQIEFNKIVGKKNCVIVKKIGLRTILNPCSMEHHNYEKDERQEDLNVIIYGIIIIIIICVFMCVIIKLCFMIKKKREVNMSYRPGEQVMPEVEPFKVDRKDRDRAVIESGLRGYSDDDDNYDETQMTDLSKK